MRLFRLDDEDDDDVDVDEDRDWDEECVDEDD